MQIKETIEKMFAGDEYALAKIISEVERNSENTGYIMQQIFPRCHGAKTIGVTGPPGAGKSSVIFHVAENLQKHSRKVAVLAIDPNSHISGGALLGDRIRMDNLKHVYIRSIGNRCQTGGISTAAYFITKILEACGYDYIFIETVGAGQSEVKIKDLSDVTMLVLAPGLGDHIQANKAGIMEIGDMLVVNKSDKPDALKLEIDLMDMLKTSSHKKHTEVYLTDCINGNGFYEMIDFLTEMPKGSNKTKEIEKLKAQCIELFENKLSQMINKSFENYSNTDEVMGSVLEGNVDIIELVENNIENIIKAEDKLVIKN